MFGCVQPKNASELWRKRNEKWMPIVHKCEESEFMVAIIQSLENDNMQTGLNMRVLCHITSRIKDEGSKDMKGDNNGSQTRLKMRQ